MNTEQQSLINELFADVKSIAFTYDGHDFVMENNRKWSRFEIFCPKNRGLVGVPSGPSILDAFQELRQRLESHKTKGGN